MVVRTTSHIFWKSLEVLGKLFEMCGSSWDVVITGRKSHALINLTQKELASILFWHVDLCIKDNYRRQEEPAILISRLLLCMRCIYVAIRLDFHKECMECTEHTLSTCLGLTSLVITYILTTTQSTALDQRRKRFDIQSLSPTLRNLYYK